MSSVRYHVVVAFGIGDDGGLWPVLERAAVTAQAASDLAFILAKDYAGAVAFTRVMEVARGYYGPATVHAIAGEVPREVRNLSPARAFRPHGAARRRSISRSLEKDARPVRPRLSLVKPAG